MTYKTKIRMFAKLLTVCLGLILFMMFVPSQMSFKNSIQQVKITALNLINSKVDGNNGRDRCCVISTGPDLKDICGRQNCISSCPDPVSFIPELDNGKAAFAKNERAFFLETQQKDKLDTRQLCAVESMSLFNPTVKVYVLFIGGRYVNYNDVTLKTLSAKYKNLNFVGVDLDEYVTGTPLEHWYQCTDWEKGSNHVSHLSDALRFLTLAKYGGYYFDLDTIQLRPVTNYRNFSAISNNMYIGSGAMHASYGHPIIQMATEEFSRNYRADIWAHNGPALLTRILKKWCGVKDFKSMNTRNCKGFHVLPRQSFYPVHYGAWREFFKENPKNMTPSWLTKEVIAVHVWNKMSAEEPIRKDSTQLYVQFARKSCPVTLSLAPHQF